MKEHGDNLIWSDSLIWLFLHFYVVIRIQGLSCGRKVDIWNKKQQNG